MYPAAALVPEKPSIYTGAFNPTPRFAKFTVPWAWLSWLATRQTTAIVMFALTFVAGLVTGVAFGRRLLCHSPCTPASNNLNVVADNLRAFVRGLPFGRQSCDRRHPC